PEVPGRAGGRGAGSTDREIEQRVDPPGLVGVVFERGSPPDVRARFEGQGRGVGRVPPGEAGEIRRRCGEAPAVQRIEPGAHVGSLAARRGGGGRGGGVLQQVQRGEAEPHRQRGRAASAALTGRPPAERGWAAGAPGWESPTATSWGVVTMIAARICTVWASESCASPVPGGRSTRK